MNRYANEGVKNVVALGDPQPKPHHATSYGVYHVSSVFTQAVQRACLE